MNYKVEFPHYDDELALPAGWLDTSWHNDVCPSFENKIDGIALEPRLQSSLNFGSELVRRKLKTMQT